MARSEVNTIYDAATAFRAPGSAALTAATEVGTVSLDVLEKVRPSSQRGKLGAQGYKVAIVVEAASFAGADEVYTLIGKVGADAGAATEVGSLSVAGAGQYILSLDAQTIENLTEDRAALHLELAVAGVAPSITFSAWLV